MAYRKRSRASKKDNNILNGLLQFLGRYDIVDTGRKEVFYIGKRTK